MAQRTVFDFWRLGDRWSKLKELCGGLLSKEDEAVLRGCLEGTAKSAIVEHEYIDKDYRSSYSGFYSKKFSRLPSRTIRLLFFDVPVTEEDLLSVEGFPQRLAKIAQDEEVDDVEGTTPGFLGSVVLRPTEYSRIGRTLLDPRKLRLIAEGEAFCCLAPFVVHLMGVALHVQAFPYQSQDTEVHSCAETALWSQFRYLSQRYRVYPEKYPYDIALLNTDLSFGRTLPSRGLTLAQVATVIGEFGLDAVTYYRDQLARRFRLSPGDDWAGCSYRDEEDAMTRLLVSYIDSGMPPLIGVPGHAVVGLGVHYGDEPVVERDGSLLLASDFASSIIVNDDNHPPYTLVQPGSDGKVSYGFKDFDSIAVPMPRKVFLTAEEAEATAVDLLRQLGPPKGLEKRWKGQLVRRTLCTSSKNYKSFRQQARDPVVDELLRQPLPHFLWLVEYYPRELWGDKQVLVEMALDATAGPFDEAAFLWIRYPDLLVLNWPRLYGDGRVGFFRIDGSSSFPGFGGNLTRIRR